MKLSTELSHEAEYLGDIQENRVGIDKNNIDFISTLLTSNLYSRPFESFFRETVSNAYDAHVEAGNNSPILILIEDVKKSGDKTWHTSNTYRISIRDYGTGLSPERFDAIYKNIGSSTKRESNDYIGMLGLGRFSCLSCADVANVTSYYNGKKYSYIMYKNGGGINIDRVSITEGDYKNGLEVSIEKEMHSPGSEFSQAFAEICMFDKVHIEYNGNDFRLKSEVNLFNNREVWRGKTFSICDYFTERSFKMGNVLYPYTRIENINDTDFPVLHTSSLFIELPIGSVDIVPNREDLQYTTRTKDVIKQKIQEVKEELKTLVDKKISKDMSMKEFLSLCGFRGATYIKLGNLERAISYNDVQPDFSNTTINGKSLPEKFFAFCKSSYTLEIDKNLIYKRLNRKRIRASIEHIVSGELTLMLKKDTKISNTTIEYYSLGGKDTLILKSSGKEELINQFYEYGKVGSGIDNKECAEFLVNNLEIKYLSNANVPETFLEQWRLHNTNRAKGNKINTCETNVRVYTKYGYHVMSLESAKCNKGLILYTKNTRDDGTLAQLAELCLNIQGIGTVITLKPEDTKLLEGNKRYMTVESFLFMRNPLLSKLITGKIIYDNFADIERTNNFEVAYIPLFKEFKKEYANYYACYLQYPNANPVFKDLYSYYISKNWINKAEIDYFTLKNKDIESYKGWEQLKSHCWGIIQNIACKKYGISPKIGLVMHSYSIKNKK